MPKQEPRPVYHRRNDLKRLKEAAIDTPLIIGDDGRKYTVEHPDSDAIALAGRYEVVYEYIRGFADAARRAAKPDTE